MKTFEEIKSILQQHKEELAATFSVKELAAFGSYVRNEQDEESDVDILVSFQDTPGLLKFIALENYLSDLLGVKVDLVTEGGIGPYLKENIMKSLKPVYGKR